MKALITSTLFLISSSLFAQMNDCTSHTFKENQNVYAWKHDGAKLYAKSSLKSGVLSIIPEGDQLTVLEELQDKLYDTPCVKDTLSTDPLVVIHSRFIKVKHGGTTGYVLDHYLNHLPPYDVLLEAKNGNLIFMDRLVWPGDYSNGESSTRVFDNGIIYYGYSNGKVTYTQSYLIPFINEASFPLIALKMLAEYGRNEEEGVYFECDGTFFQWIFTDPTEEMPGDKSILIEMTPYGLRLETSETGC